MFEQLQKLTSHPYLMFPLLVGAAIGGVISIASGYVGAYWAVTLIGN